MEDVNLNVNINDRGEPKKPEPPVDNQGLAPPNPIQSVSTLVAPRASASQIIRDSESVYIASANFSIPTATINAPDKGIGVGNLGFIPKPPTEFTSKSQLPLPLRTEVPVPSRETPAPEPASEAPAKVEVVNLPKLNAPGGLRAQGLSEEAERKREERRQRELDELEKTFRTGSKAEQNMLARMFNIKGGFDEWIAAQRAQMPGRTGPSGPSGTGLPPPGPGTPSPGGPGSPTPPGGGGPPGTPPGGPGSPPPPGGPGGPPPLPSGRGKNWDDLRWRIGLGRAAALRMRRLLSGMPPKMASSFARKVGRGVSSIPTPALRAGMGLAAGRAVTGSFTSLGSMGAALGSAVGGAGGLVVGMIAGTGLDLAFRTITSTVTALNRQFKEMSRELAMISGPVALAMAKAEIMHLQALQYRDRRIGKDLAAGTELDGRIDKLESMITTDIAKPFLSIMNDGKEMWAEFLGMAQPLVKGASDFIGSPTLEDLFSGMGRAFQGTPVGFLADTAAFFLDLREWFKWLRGESDKKKETEHEKQQLDFEKHLLQLFVDPVTAARPIRSTLPAPLQLPRGLR